MAWGTQTGIVFTRTYDETLDLIVEARNYMTHTSNLANTADRWRYPICGSAVEALRVTSRLTQVMAWLMLQRAVQYGEI